MKMLKFQKDITDLHKLIFGEPKEFTAEDTAFLKKVSNMQKKKRKK